MSTSPAPACVSIRRVNRTFGTLTVLDHVDIEIAPGEVVALLGSSGSGESTLLRIVAGLARPTDGRIEIDGNAVRGIDPRCAVVFQEPRLLPWRSLAANVAFGLPPGHRAIERCCRSSALARCRRVRRIRRSLPAASVRWYGANALASRVPLPGDPASCCSTSRWRPLTHSPACGCRTCLTRCNKRPELPRFW